MMSINLLSNEGIVEQFDRVGCESPDFKGYECGELILTTVNLVFTYTQIKMFAKDVEHTFSWPLRDIKVVQGKPQLIIDQGDAHQCDIMLRHGKLELRMYSHVDLVKLANGVNKLITGSDEDIVGAPKTFISGIASMLSDAGREVTEAFGMRNPAKSGNTGSKTVSRCCAGCGAPLHGRQGTSVTCEYCSRSEQL